MYLTIINVTINVEESSSAAGDVVAPLSFVASSIRPDLDTVSVSLSILYLALIYSTIWEHKFIFEFQSLFLG